MDRVSEGLEHGDLAAEGLLLLVRLGRVEEALQVRKPTANKPKEGSSLAPPAEQWEGVRAQEATFTATVVPLRTPRNTSPDAP